jgi:hypothetical protein
MFLDINVAEVHGDFKNVAYFLSLISAVSTSHCVREFMLTAFKLSEKAVVEA